MTAANVYFGAVYFGDSALYSPPRRPHPRELSALSPKLRVTETAAEVAGFPGGRPSCLRGGNALDHEATKKTTWTAHLERTAAPNALPIRLAEPAKAAGE